MMSKGARNIVLLSRSGKATGKVADLVDEATNLGATITVLPCDVSDKSQVEKLIAEDLSPLPPIRGVVHGAMVLHDVLFEKMSFSQWNEVVKPKVAGAWNFHNALLDTPLDFFIALSSAAGAVGNRGQTAYAAANTFLNSFVQYRNQLGLSASSIDLTAVSDVGYLAENAERQAQVAENLGSETIEESEVLALIAAAITGRMKSNCNNHCITGLKIGAQMHELFWVDDAKFAHLKAAAVEAQAQESSSSTDKAISLSSALKSAKSHDLALNIVVEGLITKVSAVLMVPREEMDPSKPIVVYGLDSLVAIEIRNWITRELEASLQVLELLTSSSIRALGDAILTKSKLVDVSKLAAGGEPEAKSQVNVAVEVKKFETEVKSSEPDILVDRVKTLIVSEYIQVREYSHTNCADQVDTTVPATAPVEVATDPASVDAEPASDTLKNAQVAAQKAESRSLVNLKGNEVKISTISLGSNSTSPTSTPTEVSSASSPIDNQPMSIP
jgi:NADP-dependent 3-hydroxy acid dehydrogenase YdfG/aryl carrier-like protein